MKVQFINSENGDPAYAVLPIELFNELASGNEDLIDACSAETALNDVDVPWSIATRLLNGENPITVWRTHLQISERKLAQKCGISLSDLHEIESQKKEPSISTLKRIAEELGVAVDDLVMD